MLPGTAREREATVAGAPGQEWLEAQAERARWKEARTVQDIEREQARVGSKIGKIRKILQTSPKRRLSASLRGAAAGGLKEFAVRR